MIKIISTLFIYLLLSIVTMQAQEKSFEEKVKILSEKIEEITADERLALKEEIKEINSRLKANEISETEAQQLKKEAAERSAIKIQQRVSTIEKQLQDLIQHKVDNEIFREENRRRFRIGGFDVDYDTDYRFRRRHRKYRRTRSYTVLAFGLNNLVTDGSLNSIDNSTFDFWRSRFFEWGVNHKTRIFKNNGLFYIDYGFSVMYNALRPNRNQFYVDDGNTTSLQTHPIDLDKSKFKNVQLVFPVFLELDFSRPMFSESDKKVRYRTNRSVRMGAGGFVGINLKTKQVLKYEQGGNRKRDVQKGDFNTNNFVYGLSAFIGHRDTSFYVKYNLNELFKNALTEQNNISFGIRFDW